MAVVKNETATREQIASLPTGLVPRHIALVMDGNGRWAQERGLARTEGHKRGESVLISLVEECLELIQRSNGRELAERDVEHYRGLAEAELAKLPDNEVTEALRHLLAFSLDRLG